jgi:Ca2+-binding EF-hand superfamily protein
MHSAVSIMDAESTNAQDARIEELFRALDVGKKGHLDLDNLRAGLKRIDHRMLARCIALATSADYNSAQKCHITGRKDTAKN